MYELREWCKILVLLISSLTVCYVLKEDYTVVKGNGWFSTFFKITDPSSNRKANRKFVKFIFPLTSFSVASQPTWRNLTSYPGLMKRSIWAHDHTVAQQFRSFDNGRQSDARKSTMRRLVEWQRRWVGFGLEKASFLLMITFWANPSLQLSSSGSMDHRDGAVRHFVGV